MMGRMLDFTKPFLKGNKDFRHSVPGMRADPEDQPLMVPQSFHTRHPEAVLWARWVTEIP